jgi:hypothetical protein
MRFKLRSEKKNPVSIRINLKTAFSATDNLGTRLHVVCHYYCNDFSTTIDPGRQLQLFRGGGISGFVEVDTTDTDRSEIIVTVSQLLGIENARWRIPIYH